MNILNKFMDRNKDCKDFYLTNFNNFDKKDVNEINSLVQIWIKTIINSLFHDLKCLRKVYSKFHSFFIHGFSQSLP